MKKKELDQKLLTKMICKKEKQTSEREQLLRNIISKIRSALDIEETKKLIVTEIGRLFKADRCIIREFDPKMEYFLPPTPSAEFLASGDVKSLTGYCSLPESSKIFLKLLESEKMLATDDIENFLKEYNLTGTIAEAFVRDFSIKSGIVHLVLSYEDRILGLLALHYTKKKVKLSEENIAFIQSVADEIAISMHQSSLYEKGIQLAEREKLINKVIATITGSLDIEKIKKALTHSIGKFLNFNRCFIIEYSVDEDTYLPVNKYSEYRSSENVKSTADYDLNDEGFELFKKIGKNRKELFVANNEDFIEKNKEYITETIINYLKYYNIKSGFQVPLFYGNYYLGVIAGHSDKIRDKYTDEEKEFIKTLASQTGIALYQAKLYERKKQTAAKESIQRKFLETIRSTLDKDEFKKIAVNEAGKIFGADRCFFVAIDKKTDCISRPEIQYTSSDDITIIRDFKPFHEATSMIKNILLQEGMIYIPDTGKFLEEKKLRKSSLADFFKVFSVKSDFAVPVWNTETEIAYLVLHYTQNYKRLSQEEINLLKSLASHATVAFKQADLFEETQKTAQKERLLREIVETMRSTLDLDTVKKAIVELTGKALKLDRCFISYYDPINDRFTSPSDFLEYRSSKEVKSIVNYKFSLQEYELIVRMAKEGVEIFESDVKDFIERNKENVSNFLLEYFENYNLRAGFQVPMFYGNIPIGIFCGHYVKELPEPYTEEDKDFIRIIAHQSAMVIYQLQLYEKERQTAERAVLFGKIVTTFRSYLDPNEIKKSIVSQIGKAFNTDRCFFVEYDENDNAIPIDKYAEYLPSKSEESLVEVDLENYDFRYWTERLKEAGKELIYTDFETHIKEKHLEGTVTEKYSKHFNFKAGMGFPLFKNSKITGLFVLNYSGKIEYPSQDDINFLKTLVEQIDIALYQAKLYEKEKQTAERERILREIIETIRSTFDIEKMKRYFVDTVGKYFNADRAYMAEISEDKIHLAPVNPVYIKSPDIQNVAGYDLETESARYFPDELRAGRDVNFSDSQVYINEHNLQNTSPGHILNELKIKSCIFIPIKHIDKMAGMIGVHYTKDYVEITPEKVNFLRAISDQVGIALYQAKLYEKEKQTAERERLIRSIISTIRSTLDLKDIKIKVVNEIGKILKADRVLFGEYLQKSRTYIVDEFSEYSSSPDLKTFVNFDLSEYPGFQYIQSRHEQKKDVIYNDLDKFLDENNLRGTNTEKFCQDFEIRALFAICMIYQDQFLGNLVIHYKTPKDFTDEDLEFMKILASQAGVAIYQSRLYEKEKQTAERESLLRGIIQTVRSTLDVNKIKLEIITSIGLALNAQRVFINEFDEKKQEYLPVKEEYLASQNLRSAIGFNPDKDSPELGNTAKKQPVIVENTEKFLKENNLQDSLSAGYLRKYGIKSGFSMPLIYADKFLGIFVLHFIERSGAFGEDEIRFVKTLADQTSIALYQSKLYEKEKGTAERERILREIVEVLRSAISKDEIKDYFVEITRDYFDADRCLLAEHDKKTGLVLPFRLEKLKYPEIPSLKGLNIEEQVPEYVRKAEKGKNIIVKDLEKAILRFKKRGIQHKAIESMYKAGVKSDYGLSVKYGDIYYGTLIIHFTDRKRILTHEEFAFLKTLRNQVGTALYQAKLYEKEKQTAEREALLRRLGNVIRSSLDINELKRNVVNEIGPVLNADRCLLYQIDQNTGKFLVVDENSEYLSSPELRSHVGVNLEEEHLYPFKKIFQYEKRELIIPDVDNPPEEYDPMFGKLLKEYNVKSNYTIPITYKDDVLGIFYINYAREKREITEEELNFFRALADQVGIAFHQANLYEKERKQARKESILREIISEIRATQSIDDAYNYILAKLTTLFNINRAIFIEFPSYKTENPSVKYEYLKDKKTKSFKYVQFPQTCLKMFEGISNTLEPVIVNNIKKFHTDEESQTFFNEYGVKSFIIIPLVRYNHDIKVLGILGLCCSRIKNWKQEDIDLLQAITGSIVNVVWDITKLIELNTLRDTFVLTLAHDLQVPIIGEKKALELIISKNEEVKIREIKPIIKDILDNNNDINKMLSKLIEIYNYEMGRKKLEYSEQNIEKVLTEVYESLEYLAISKSIVVEFEVEESLPEFSFDIKEIEKVFEIILRNSFEYIQSGGNVKINIHRKNNRVITCISDNGPGLQPEFKDLVFKRYEMIKILSRKIGAGYSLYLANLIVELHKGTIEIISAEGKGTTICVYLPIIK